MADALSDPVARELEYRNVLRKHAADIVRLTCWLRAALDRNDELVRLMEAASLAVPPLPPGAVPPLPADGLKDRGS